MRRLAIAMCLVAASGCCKPKSKPAAAQDISEPVTVKPIDKIAQGLDTEDRCITFFFAMADENWVKASDVSTPPNGCEVRQATKATLTRRGQTCSKTTIPTGKCKGTWWFPNGWIK